MKQSKLVVELISDTDLNKKDNIVPWIKKRFYYNDMVYIY